MPRTIEYQETILPIDQYVLSVPAGENTRRQILVELFAPEVPLEVVVAMSDAAVQACRQHFAQVARYTPKGLIAVSPTVASCSRSSSLQGLRVAR
jgi:hypothetical protein